MPRAVKSLQVGSAVRCLEYVPEPSPTEEVETGVHKAPSGIGANICVGLDDGRWETDFTESNRHMREKKREKSFCVDIEWGKIMKLDLMEIRFIVKEKAQI